MGIDFSHCDAHWAYSGFHRFRCRLAEQVGLKDYHEIRSTDDPRFEKIENDPIVHLLAHSDCDGELTPDECRVVAPRLRELVSGWGDDFDRSKALELADGMEEAAKANEPLEFR
jgi:hypothetical protein